MSESAGEIRWDEIGRETDKFTAADLHSLLSTAQLEAIQDSLGKETKIVWLSFFSGIQYQKCGSFGLKPWRGHMYVWKLLSIECELLLVYEIFQRKGG